MASNLASVTHDIIPLDPIRLTPSAHDPSIIEGNDGNDIDTFGLDLREVLDIAGEMLDGATGCECAYVSHRMSEVLTTRVENVLRTGGDEVKGRNQSQIIPGTANNTTFLSANSALAL